MPYILYTYRTHLLNPRADNSKDNNWFEGGCLNYCHPSPRREWSGVGSCGSCATLRGLCATSGCRRWFLRRHFFIRRHRKRSKYSTETDVHFDPKSFKVPLGNPRCPKGAHRHPVGAKGRPKWRRGDALGLPKGLKGTPKFAKGNKMSSKDNQRGKNKSQYKYVYIYIYTYTHKRNTRKLPIHRHTAAG